jgi:hypothetical protein
LATELHAERLVMDDQDARRFANRCGLSEASSDSASVFLIRRRFSGETPLGAVFRRRFHLC